MCSSLTKKPYLLSVSSLLTSLAELTKKARDHSHGLFIFLESNYLDTG